MLTPSSIDLRRKSRATGGGLKPDDVKGALAALSEPASALAYAKYLKYSRYERDLFAYTFVAVLELAQSENWPSGRIEAITRCVIEDALDRACPACHGVASVNVGDHRQVCGKCAGSGKAKVSTRAIAKRLHLSPKSYYQTWRKRYAAALEILRAWDDEIRRTVRRQLKVLP